MYLMVDNYDSFTAMLASYFAELGADVLTLRNDDVDAALVRTLHQTGNLEGIIISPGPKTLMIAAIARRLSNGRPLSRCLCWVCAWGIRFLRMSTAHM